MIRTRCQHLTNYKQCQKVFRTRTKQTVCREHYRVENNKSRPIKSRELSENKYRRTRNRRTTNSKPVPKVIANRNKVKQNAISK